MRKFLHHFFKERGYEVTSVGLGEYSKEVRAALSIRLEEIIE